MLTACSPTAEERQYLFLGHPYDWRDPYRVDPRLHHLPLADFDGIWLGGDVCSRTLEQRSTLAYLDSLFGIARPTSHWAPGNHDLAYDNPTWLTAATGRPLFYVQWQEGLCVLVLNTNLLWHDPWPQPREHCLGKKAQLRLIQQVCDTIRQASHLLILHHHALLNELKISPTGDTLRLFNLNGIPVRGGCPPAEENFTAWLYPQLEEVQNRGVQVVLVGGDFGMNAKTFAYQTPAGIWLLGSGINNSLDMDYPPAYVTNFNPDSVLIFKHLPQKRQLSWSFESLSGMVRSALPADSLARLPGRVQELLNHW